MSINWQMGKQNVVHPDNGVLLKIQKEGKSDIHTCATTWIHLDDFMLSEIARLKRQIL